MFGKAPAGSDGGAAGAGEIVTIGAGDAFDDTELAQAGELSGQGGGRAFGQQRQEVGAAEAGDVETRTLEGGKQGLFNAAEKVQPPDVTAVNGTGLGQAVERADAGREVIQTGEVLKVAAVTTAQDVTQIIEAVNGLFDGSEGAGGRAPRCSTTR